jgi:hypothetical protein
MTCKTVSINIGEANTVNNVFSFNKICYYYQTKRVSEIAAQYFITQVSKFGSTCFLINRLRDSTVSHLVLVPELYLKPKSTYCPLW